MVYKSASASDQAAPAEQFMRGTSRIARIGGGLTGSFFLFILPKAKQAGILLSLYNLRIIHLVRARCSHSQIKKEKRDWRRNE